MYDGLARRVCAHCDGVGLATRMERIGCPGCNGTGAIASGACIHRDGSRGESVVVEIACPHCMGIGAGLSIAATSFQRAMSNGHAREILEPLPVHTLQAEAVTMSHQQDSRKLGLEFNLQRPGSEAVEQIPATRDAEGRVLYPEVDADGDHVHFEMVPMGGDSLLWLTIRRGISPELAASSLRKIAGLIERHGSNLLQLLEGSEGSISSEGDVIPGPLRLEYDAHGDLIIPGGNET